MLLFRFQILFFVFVLFCSVGASAETLRVTPEASDELLVNPGKGWVLYGSTPTKFPPELQKFCSLGYARFVWGKIEPNESEFHWEEIDRQIENWRKTGRQFAFGIMGASTHSSEFWTSPKWVFDAGAKYDSFELVDPKRPTAGIAGKKLVPIFDDPVYLEKLRHFVKAFAEKYDGHPAIAFIDIRSYGNWGEGHMFPFRKHEISAEKYLEHVKIYREAFHKTLLALPVGARYSGPYVPVYDWAIEHGITIRRDGTCGNSDGSEAAHVAGKTPAVLELYASYTTLKKWGWWDGIQDENRCGYTLESCVETSHGSWCNTSQDMLQAEPELMKKLANRMGYHFVFTEMEFPSGIQNDEPFPIRTTWENRGVAFCFLPAKVTFALRNAEGKIVTVCDADAAKPQKFTPDAATRVTDSVKFTGVPAGTYTLCVGILPDPGDDFFTPGKPFIKLGVKLDETDGWYAVEKVSVR